jgi:hypothetical protein
MLRDEDRSSEQARPPARRLQLRDVEQRHLRLRERYRSDYVLIPFYLVLRDARTHGVFLDNSFRSNFDVGRTSPGLLAFGAKAANSITT